MEIYTKKMKNTKGNERTTNHVCTATPSWILDQFAQMRSCEVSVSQTRHSNVLVLLLICAPGPLTTLSILFMASLHCSVKGVVHSVVRDLQFLGNLSHGIALISQNKNRLTSFRRGVFISGHFQPVIEPTNADAPDTQLV